MDEPCVFCAIVAGEGRSHPVYEDDETIAFLSIHPAAPGHTLVLPRGHVPYLWDLTDAAAAGLGRSIRRVALVLEQELRPDGLTVFQANRAAGWQSVFHVHFHLVPRAHDDRLVPAWTETLADTRELDTMSVRLRRAFASEDLRHVRGDAVDDPRAATPSLEGAQAPEAVTTGFGRRDS